MEEGVKQKVEAQEKDVREGVEQEPAVQEILSGRQEPAAQRESVGQQEASGKAAPSSQVFLPDAILGLFRQEKKDIRMYSPLALAYMGDAIYDLVIRTMVVAKANMPAHKLHHLTVQYVSARAQSEIIQALLEAGVLTEEEQYIYRRGRNAKPHTMAKNATIADYKRATGFEALCGYLYLTGHMERLLELVRTGIRLIWE